MVAGTVLSRETIGVVAEIIRCTPHVLGLVRWFVVAEIVCYIGTTDVVAGTIRGRETTRVVARTVPGKKTTGVVAEIVRCTHVPGLVRWLVVADILSRYFDNI